MFVGNEADLRIDLLHVRLGLNWDRLQTSYLSAAASTDYINEVRLFLFQDYIGWN
jgi:hypothetical protein